MTPCQSGYLGLGVQGGEVLKYYHSLNFLRIICCWIKWEHVANTLDLAHMPGLYSLQRLQDGPSKMLDHVYRHSCRAELCENNAQSIHIHLWHGDSGSIV